MAALLLCLWSSQFIFAGLGVGARSALSGAALAQLEHAISDGGTPTLELLEETGAAVADSLHGHFDAVMYAYFDKEYVNSTSDAIALATIRELGLLWAPPSKSSWQEELSSRIHQLQLQSDNDELSLKIFGFELLGEGRTILDPCKFPTHRLVDQPTPVGRQLATTAVGQCPSQVTTGCSSARAD